MELDAAHILELVGLETILAALFAGTLASALFLRSRTKPISLGLIGPESGDRDRRS
jgi:uncharacterized membrane protein